MKLAIFLCACATVQVAYAAILVWRKKRVVSDPNIRRIVGRVLK